MNQFLNHSAPFYSSPWLTYYFFYFQPPFNRHLPDLFPLSRLLLPTSSRVQVLGHQVSEQHLPDVALIGEHGDITELGRLVQLVLGCAISCEKKQGE